jgi:hypothetical protein
MIYLVNNKNYNISNFTIYGERHSGTKLLEELISKNFDIPITWNYGWKHWFGFCNVNDLERANNTLFIGIVRNPYDWIMAMKKMPHHVPNHNKKFNELIHNEWYSISDKNIEIYEDRSYISKKRYNNIFDMRSKKLQYLVNYMPFLVGKYALTRYEDLISNKEIFLSTIKRYFRLDRKIEKDSTKVIKTNYITEKETLDIINKNIDWRIEKIFDYHEYKYE